MRKASLVLAAAAVLVTVPLLSACATQTDPVTARKSLSEVTADPAPPEADDEYDASAHPEPMVDPLSCSRYLVITARGTGESKKQQLVSTIAKAISEARPGEVQRLDLDYPADTEVKEGSTRGARLLVDTLNVQAEECPAQQFILLGYSQGALVIGDALSDPAVRIVGATVGEVDARAAANILAIVFYGDPRFVGDEPYNAGTFSRSVNGLLPRPLGSLSQYDQRIRDYCVGTDFICQASLDLNEKGHAAYYKNGMLQDGAAFVVTLLPPAQAETE